MGCSRKGVFGISLPLLLVMLLLMEASCDGSARFGSLKARPSSSSSSSSSSSASASDISPLSRSHGSPSAGAVFGDMKRKVYAGPNPLHNR